MAGNGQPVITHTDYSLVTANSPAQGGEIVVVFCTGLGQVTPSVSDGTSAPVPAAQTSATPQVTIGGGSADVLFQWFDARFCGIVPGEHKGAPLHAVWECAVNHHGQWLC
jgi:uncharacterized protein (TIGR03437 family)